MVQGLQFVCSDMWKPYLQVLAKQAKQALHVLDRFHITQHLNEAVDEVRRAESSRLRAAGKAKAEQLKHMRWPLLRRGSRVRGRVRQKLLALWTSKLATGRAWELKETFSHFWKYKAVFWAQAFLDYWCFRALRSRLEPMQKVAGMLRAHEHLILNWFRAKGEISAGVCSIKYYEHAIVEVQLEATFESAWGALLARRPAGWTQLMPNPKGARWLAGILKE